MQRALISNRENRGITLSVAMALPLGSWRSPKLPPCAVDARRCDQGAEGRVLL